MEPRASDIYEIVLEAPAERRRWFDDLAGLFTRRAGPSDVRVGIVSVQERATGVEVFRHIEDIGDDEAHVLRALEADLASMTVSEFEARWVR